MIQCAFDSFGCSSKILLYSSRDLCVCVWGGGGHTWGRHVHMGMCMCVGVTFFYGINYKNNDVQKYINCMVPW
jgi:hypothetical protein